MELILTVHWRWRWNLKLAKTWTRAGARGNLVAVVVRAWSSSESLPPESLRAWSSSESLPLVVFGVAAAGRPGRLRRTRRRQTFCLRCMEIEIDNGDGIDLDDLLADLSGYLYTPGLELGEALVESSATFCCGLWGDLGMLALSLYLDRSGAVVVLKIDGDVGGI